MTGEEIKMLRWEHNLSQQKLAEMVKVDRVTIAKAEADQYVSEKTMFKIEQVAKELGENV